MVSIDGDLLDIIGQIKDLDPRLSVQWSVQGEYFQILERMPDGHDEMVFTTLALDQQVLDRLRLIASVDYDYVKELDRVDAQVDRDADHRFGEQAGEAGERLAHALRRDVQHKGKAFIGKEV